MGETSKILSRDRDGEDRRAVRVGFLHHHENQNRRMGEPLHRWRVLVWEESAGCYVTLILTRAEVDKAIARAAANPEDSLRPNLFARLCSYVWRF